MKLVYYLIWNLVLRVKIKLFLRWLWLSIWLYVFFIMGVDILNFFFFEVVELMKCWMSCCCSRCFLSRFISKVLVVCFFMFKWEFNLWEKVGVFSYSFIVFIVFLDIGGNLFDCVFVVGGVLIWLGRNVWR